MVAWQAVVTLVDLAVMLVLLATEVAPPDMVIFGCLIVFIPLEIITVQEAVQGFCNTGMLTVAVLFVVATGVDKTGAVEPVRRFLERAGRVPDGVPAPLRRILFIVMLPVSLLSAFLNNTPVVAMMIPVLDSFGRRIRVSPSKLLLPLSYASIFGGTCSLIGTSTNLVVFGLAQERDPTFSMGIFEIAQVGIPVMLLGWLYILVAAPRYLPSRLGVTQALDRPREYITVLAVKHEAEDGSGLAGKSIAEAGLRSLPGLFLVQIERASHDVVTAPGPETLLAEGDKLYMAGVVDSVLGLSQIKGLKLEEDREDQQVDLYRLKGKDILVEAVVAAHSAMCHHTVREVNFRSRYNAAILAVHRHGTRIDQRIGDIELQAGDSLLLVASRDFLELNRNREDFALVSQVQGHQALRRNKAFIAVLLTAGMVAASLAGVSLLTAGLFASGGLMIARCITPHEAREAINLQVLLVIAGAFGLSAAMVNSGAADEVAGVLVKAADPTGKTGLYIMIYAATTLFSQAVTNNAAITIMFPIAFSAAADTGLDFRPFMFLLMMGASSSYMTPTGYQTNLMVYGPGGYTFMDYVRFGGLLQLFSAVVTIGVIVALEFWYLWAIAFAGAIGVTLFLTWTPKSVSPSRRVSRRQSTTSIGDGNNTRQTKYFFQPDMGLDPIDDFA